jgi:hypothetical protein
MLPPKWRNTITSHLVRPIRRKYIRKSIPVPAVQIAAVGRKTGLSRDTRHKPAILPDTLRMLPEQTMHGGYYGIVVNTAATHADDRIYALHHRHDITYGLTERTASRKKHHVNTTAATRVWQLRYGPADRETTLVVTRKRG